MTNENLMTKFKIRNSSRPDRSVRRPQDGPSGHSAFPEYLRPGQSIPHHAERDDHRSHLAPRDDLHDTPGAVSVEVTIRPRWHQPGRNVFFEMHHENNPSAGLIHLPARRRSRLAVQFPA